MHACRSTLEDPTADNGRAKTSEELRRYFREYRRRSPYGYLRARLEQQAVHVIRPMVEDTRLARPLRAVHAAITRV